MKNPKKSAYSLGQRMRKFQHALLTDEVSIDTIELYSQMDWHVFNKVIQYLEFTYLNKHNHKPQKKSHEKKF